MAEEWPYFKPGSEQGALTAAERDILYLMKIAPVPLFMVIDGSEGIFDAVDIYYERLHFISELDVTTPQYMTHAKEFYVNAMTSYTASARKITILAAIFAALPTQEDKIWAYGRLLTLCPFVFT